MRTMTRDEVLAVVSEENEYPDLTNTDLRGLDLRGVYLKNANFTNSRLIGANLEGTNLYYANFTRADLSHARLSKSYPRHANFAYAYLVGADFSGTRTTWANLRNAYATGANFDKARLEGTQFWSAHLVGASFVEASLWHTDFWSATLRDADMTDAEFEYASLERVRSGPPVLQVIGLPSGNVVFVPYHSGWRLQVGCWTGTCDELSELIAGEDWPAARGDVIIHRRPGLEALLVQCRAWMDAYPDAVEQAVAGRRESKRIRAELAEQATRY